MYKLSKRLSSLALALTMLLLCVMATSAAEPVSAHEMQSSINEVTTPRIMQSIRSGQTGGGDSGFPGIYTGQVTITSDQYFTIAVGTSTTCLVNINGTANSGSYYSGNTSVQSTNGSVINRTVTCRDGKFPAGTYAYNVIFTDPNAVYAFELLMTDFNYN